LENICGDLRFSNEPERVTDEIEEAESQDATTRERTARPTRKTAGRGVSRPGGEFREETSIAGQTTRNPAGRQMREGIHQAGVPAHEPLPARAPAPTVAVATPATEETMDDTTRVNIFAHQIVLKALLVACLPVVDASNGWERGTTHTLLATQIRKIVTESLAEGDPLHPLVPHVLEKIEDLLGDAHDEEGPPAPA
jgi:hypothetical protein